MRMSQLFSRTLREAPTGAESRGYENLLRAGYIIQLGAGIFSALPLGYRSIKKIEQIIREEMDRIGGQEMLMPVVNPADIWKETGRYFSIDKELSRFQDRVGRDMVLAMTHEEAVTDIARQEIDSYKRLPVMVYHLQTKWRDDPRPRAGLIRVREFTMKDSYTFDRDFDGLEKQYAAHYDAYFRIFKRCGLPVIAVGSDTGMMGGKVAHEYMYLSDIGEDSIAICPECGYTANRQVASFKKEFYPEDLLAIKEVETPDTATIEDLARFLAIPKRKTAKALFVIGTFTAEDGTEEERLITAVVRGDLAIEEAKLQKAAGANRIRPAHDEEITAAGMVPGYGSPIGTDCMIIVDDSVANSSNLVAGANKPGYHLLNTNFNRDYSGTVADIASADSGYACAQCGGTLELKRGIEVGNIFQLGTRYSEAMNCLYQDEDGTRKPVVMGSYGIGVGRLLACLAEEYSFAAGMALPITTAPYQVHLVSLVKNSDVPDQLYSKLLDAGIDVLFDDRKDSPGVKFNDADLIGVPIRVTIGNRTLKQNAVEVTLRETADSAAEVVAIDSFVHYIRDVVKSMQERVLS